MKTIEERAMWYQRGYLNTSPQYKPTLYNAYIAGAIEQREIDIQRAREIRCNLCAGLCKGNAACGELKEITKYMKG